MSILDAQIDGDKAVERTSGVVACIVTNNKDPDGLGRLKVKFPWFSDNNETDWIRMTIFMAWVERGSFFLPEVGDEVLVAFEHGNINRPYVIGALWNGVDKPPETNSDSMNNIRKIKSRNGHELIFNDSSGEERIDIRDKTGNNLILIDSVENSITIVGQNRIDINSGNNPIVINSEENSIVVSSQMKTEIRSGNNSITIDSAANSITISSQAQLNIKSQIINIEAQEAMTIKSSGILTLQGSLVKIN